MTFQNTFSGKRVFLTGHTGFKGSWLASWLLKLGAEVTGYSLDPNNDQPLFDQLGLSGRLKKDVRADIRDRDSLSAELVEAQPDFVFHLAAQPLVILGYYEPTETFDTNVMGSVNLLEAVRAYDQPCAVVMVTTDKCYENREWIHSYRENDPMGGYDPYSASKGCAELVVSCYQRSFFGDDSPISVSAGRAGNVIGGGDFAENRIVPDCARALAQGKPVGIRNPHATRPWQHVLEPLSGYLALAEALFENTLPDEVPDVFSGGFNFGPNLMSNQSVGSLVEEFLKSWPGGESRLTGTEPAYHEASKLNLAIDKAFHFLDWSPVWDFAAAVAKTADWYRRVAKESGDPVALVAADIDAYVADAAASGVKWAQP